MTGLFQPVSSISVDTGSRRCPESWVRLCSFEFWAERWAKHCIDRWRHWVQDTESVAESRYFWEDKPMTLWRRRFAGKQRGVYRPLQHAQYSGQTKTHHFILFYAEYLWSLNLHLAGWIAGLKEKLSANSFLVQCVCCAWFPRIFQLAYPNACS